MAPPRRGRAFPFFSCGDTECLFGDGAALETDGAGPAGRWRGTAVHRGVGEMALALEATGPDTLRARVREAETVLTRTDPPLGEAAATQTSLASLGAFAAVEPVGRHVRVTQLWLWEDGPDLLAVGVLETLLPGTRADFVQPVRLGRGAPDGEGHRFGWERRGELREAHVEVTDSGVVRTPTGEGWDRGSRGRPPPGAVHLAPAPVFHDEAIELAPLDDAAAWDAWMDAQLLHHFTSGSVPRPSARP